jgi:hypothetical protein
MFFLNSGMGTVVCEDKIFCCGGSAKMKRVEMFTQFSENSELMKQMCAPRVFSTAAVYNGMVFVVGGSGLNEMNSSVEYFDLKMKKWILVKPMNCIRLGAGLAELGGNLYAAGIYIY